VAGIGHRQALNRGGGGGNTTICANETRRHGRSVFAVFVAANYIEGNHSANSTLQMIDTVSNDSVENIRLNSYSDYGGRRQKKLKRRPNRGTSWGLRAGHAIDDSLRLRRRFTTKGRSLHDAHSRQ